MAVLGVDGWRGAWVGALLDGRSASLLALADVAAVLSVPDVRVVAIDMPIGLSDDGVRVCDEDARELLRRSGAASSVFPSPVRAVLPARDYAHARELSRAATAGLRAPSAQTWQLEATTFCITVSRPLSLRCIWRAASCISRASTRRAPRRMPS